MSRTQVVFAVLGGLFLTSALVAEMIGAKIVFVGNSTWHAGPFGPFATSVGVIPLPVVFVTTDLVHEYFGRRGVRRLTLLAIALLAYAWMLLLLTMRVHATPSSAVDDTSYDRVFGRSRWVLVGSLLAFVISQLVDVAVFHALRRRTGRPLLWLRSTGSTVVSQLVDNIVVLWIGMTLPLGWSLSQFTNVAVPNYLVRLEIAVAVTPLMYVGRWIIERYLGPSVAAALSQEAARGRPGAVLPLRLGRAGPGA